MRHLPSRDMLYDEIKFDLGSRYQVFAGPDVLDWFRINRPPSGMFVAFNLWYTPYRFDIDYIPVPPMVIVEEEGRQTKSISNQEWSDAPYEMVDAYTNHLPFYYSLPRKCNTYRLISMSIPTCSTSCPVSL